MAQAELILGIDIGTTTVKVAAYTLDGQERWRQVADYPTRRAGAVSEQDPEHWMAAIGAALSALEAQGLAPAIRALGITSQVNTHVFVGAGARALRPAITWADTRCDAVAGRLDGGISEAERAAWWGAAMGVDASHMAARMAWVAEAEPEVWAATETVLLPKDFAIARLTGARLSDPVSHVGAVGLDGGFVPPFERIDGAPVRLPALADPMERAGMVTLPGAEVAIPVVAGVMDAWAALFGVGARASGDAIYLSGTSEIPGVLGDAVHPTPGVLVFPPWRGLRFHAAPTQSGGAALGWLCELFDTTPEALMAEVAALPPDAATPLFLPHLAGERAPLWDGAARGTFLGLEGGMGRAALARGVLEGVAMSVRLAYEALDASAGFRAGRLLCGGGGFRSEVWNRIRADMLGRELSCLSVRDPGALGAAALASVAAGLHDDLDAAISASARPGATFSPDPEGVDRAEARFALYRDAYEGARATNHALARLNAKAAG